TTGTVFAVFDKPVHMYRGTAQSGIVMDEARLNPSRGFVGGYQMELLPQGLPSFAQNVIPGGWGREHSWVLDRYANVAGLWVIGEDLAQETNRITVHPDKKDQFGMPIPDVHFDDHPNDAAMREHGYKQGTALYDSIGAKKIVKVPPYPSTHNMGTARMSENPRDGVVNRYGQSHDVKNLFVSDGSQFASSGGENPTLTIVALALRQSEYIEEQMRTGAI
ncbi:MAG: GMC oxidoreductase, partial [Candidatus Acidiferrales bacterium]